MSPILVRPVREQLEHDRVIRLLQAKYKRKFEVAINPGNEQTMPAGNGPSPWYPDLVLQTSDRARKLAGVVEVETVESVNHLEAMSQWVSFGRLRVPFHLYLPTAAIDTGRRFCSELGIPVAELWAFNSMGDQIRFTLIQRSARGPEEKPARPAAAPARAAAARRPAAAATRARAARPAASRTTRRAAAATPRRKAAKASPRTAAKKTARTPSRAQKRK